MDTSAALSSSTLRVRRWRERQREERQENALFRIATCMIRAHAAEQTLETAAKKLYGKDHGLDLIWRAVSNPATLTNPGWADTVGHNVVRSDLIQKITGLSAAAALMEARVKVDLTGVASITIPGRKYNPASGGGWIAEGAPIPVKAPIIIPGPKLVPRKLAVISAFTEEMVMADSIEEFTTAAIKEAVAGLLDTKMFSTNAGDATAPAGILLGATTVPPTAATEPWAISSDIGALVEALALNGGGLEPIIIAAPGQAAALRMWRQQDYYDIAASLALPAGTVVAVEKSSFVSGLDGIPRFETVTGATIHMEDTTPADIVSGGTAASPVKSLFQTNVIGLRMVLNASWGMRNPLHVAVMSGVSW
jgi:hypothetical protein